MAENERDGERINNSNRINNGANGGKILAAILDGAKLDAKAVTERAQAETRALLDAARERAAAEKSARLAAARLATDGIKVRAISAARLACARRMLELKRELLGEAVNSAEKKLNDMPKTDAGGYARLALNMAKATGAAKGSAVELRREDGALAEIFEEAGYAARVVGESDQAGFVIRDGAVIYDCRFGAILAAGREQVEKAAAAVLFGGD
jgi:vacuolar-type H+-ATPase subunit E/Vma4